MDVAHRKVLASALVSASVLTGLAACHRGARPAPATARPTGATVVMGGAAEGGPSEASNNHLGFPELNAGWRESGYRLDWIGYPFVGNTKVDGLRTLTILPDAVVSQDSNSVVSLLDARTGQTKWSVDLGTPLTKFCGITRDPVDPTRLVVSSEGEAIIMSSAGGNILAREKFSRVVNTSPVAEGGTYVYGTAVGEIIGHRLGFGIKAWGFQGVGPIRANPVRVGGVVGTVSQGGDITFIDPRSGALVGRARIYGGVDNQPVAAGDALVVAGLDQSVWCFNTSGQERWRVRTPHKLTNQPTVIGDRVFLDIPGDGLTAFDVNTGATVWKNPSVSGHVFVKKGNNLFALGKNTVSVIDAQRGDLIRAIPAPGITRIESDKAEDGTLYAVSDRNVIARIVAK
ncbi:MAG: PQQ-binding-like beta-propeller repeat protein [Phycisphaerales bacterium]